MIDRIMKACWWDLCMVGLPRFYILFTDGSRMVWHECDNKVNCSFD